MIKVHFYKPRTLLEKSVSFFGRTKYCHASIQYGDRVTESSLGYGVTVRTDVFWELSDAYLPIKGVLEQDVFAWVAWRIGERYGLLDCAQAVIRKWTGIKIGGNPRGMLCSEYACELLRANGGPDIEARYGITPDELYKALRDL